MEEKAKEQRRRCSSLPRHINVPKRTTFMAQELQHKNKKHLDHIEVYSGREVARESGGKK